MTIDDDLDAMFDKVDRLLCSGSFSDVDRILKCVDFDRLSLDMFVGYLGITFCVKDKLSERAGFIERAKMKYGVALHQVGDLSLL